MRRLILQEWVSLDGFAADSNGGTDFFGSPALNEGSDEDILHFMDSIDTILLGAETYHMFVEYWPTATTDTEIIADRLNETLKIVFSQTLTHAPWGTWKDADIVKTDAVEEVRRLKQQPGKDMVLWGSLSLTQALISARQIDEYHLRVCPVALGKGRRLFGDDDAQLDLKLIDAKTYETGLVLLRYQPNA